MERNYIPQRGVDFDDFIGTTYFENHIGLERPQMVPVFCPKNGNHDDDFIGIRVSGYATKAKNEEDMGKLVQLIVYPTKEATEADIDRLFKKVEAEDGTVKYLPKESASSLDEVYIRVCYSKEEGKADNLKWVAAVNGGELFHLSGERRVYQPKDAEL